MSRQTHYFLAVPIPDEIKLQLGNWVEDGKEQNKFKSWVYPQDYHITLHFLGGISSEQLDRIHDVLPRFLRAWPPFELSITHYGSFGETKTPRVFWAGLGQEPALDDLQEKLGEVLSGLGLEIERRPYRPHITLARKWEGDNPFILPEMESVAWTFLVDQVILYRTHLDRLPRYEGFSKFPFSSI